MVLYSNNIKSSINLMLRHLLQFKSALVYLQVSLFFEPERLNIDPNMEMPKELTKIVSRTAFRTSLSRAHGALELICKFLGVCQADSATMSTVLAALQYICVHIRDAECMNDSERVAFNADLNCKAEGFVSSIHCLACF